MALSGRADSGGTSTTTSLPSKPPPKLSKFSGLQACSPSPNTQLSWPALQFQCDTEETSNASSIWSCTLPDDPCSISPPPDHHDRRTVYHTPSLLSRTEVASLLHAVRRDRHLLHEREAQCIVAVEDGRPQDNHLQRALTPLLEKTLVPWANRVLLSAMSSSLRSHQHYPPCHQNYNNKHDEDKAPDTNNSRTQPPPPLVVADALVRCYTPDRAVLAPHYDLTTYASVIVPLTVVDGGLYVQTGASVDTRRDVPLPCAGDAVVHVYNVLHGVQVRSGVRYSLVVWLVPDENIKTYHNVENNDAKDPAMSGSADSSPEPPQWIQRDATLSVHAAFLYANALGALAMLDTTSRGHHNTNRRKMVVPMDTPDDRRTAQRDTYEWAAARGHAHSQYALAMLLCSPTWLPDGMTLRDPNPRVVELLVQTAASGLALAQHELGTLYKQGYCGLEPNATLARQCYSSAAQQGHWPSQRVLEQWK